MKLIFNKIKLKQEYDRLQILHWGHFSLLALAMLLEFFYTSAGFSSFFKIIFLFVFYSLYYKTVKQLFYTFWSFTAVLAVYILISIMQSLFISANGGPLEVYFLAAILLAAEVYLLSSPIYFPRVSWWEYDFRYRDEVKAIINQRDNTFDGRLSDLRRGAGCLVAFKSFDLGSILNIAFDGENSKENFEVEVMSQRQYSLGRGQIYGIKFLLNSEEDKQRYEKFCKFWKSVRSSKLKMKFKNNYSHVQ